MVHDEMEAKKSHQELLLQIFKDEQSEVRKEQMAQQQKIIELERLIMQKDKERDDEIDKKIEARIKNVRKEMNE